MNRVWETFEKILPSGVSRWVRKLIPGDESPEQPQRLLKKRGKRKPNLQKEFRDMSNIVEAEQKEEQRRHK